MFAGFCILGLLIQYGLKVTCEQTHNVRDTLKRTYAAAEMQFSKRDRVKKVLHYLKFDCTCKLGTYSFVNI